MKAAKRNLSLLTITLALIVASCASVNPGVDAPEYWPTEAWRMGAPEAHNLNPDQLVRVTETIQQDLPYLDGLIIVRDGYILYERYFNGYDADALHQIASVTKCWTSAAIGVARSQGHLTELDAPLSALLTDYFQNDQHADKREITLEDLLMMRSGIDYQEEILNAGGYGGEELLAQDLTEFALSFPMAYEPGEAWNYSTLDAQLTGAVIEYAVQHSLASFTSAHLFAPMGITEYQWLADATGSSVGGQNLEMRPRDMTKLGLLFLHAGRWEDRQLIPEDWVRRSISPQDTQAYYPPTETDEIIDWYGYYWWTWGPEWYLGQRAFQARGYAGQQVLVFPELDMIIATTANMEGVSPDAADEQEAEIYTLIKEGILPALMDVDLRE